MPSSNTMSIGQRLRDARERLNWSQERLAEAVGTTARSINRWEQDKVAPQPHYREQLCRIFEVSADVLFGLSTDEEREDLAQLPLWNVPYRRNPFFTGREEVLQLLHDALHRHPMAALTQVQAISGLGGIGKTQIAIEYAYRYRVDYQAVLWVRAETYETLSADFAGIASLLHLRNRDERDQPRTIEAVKCWLRDHTDWLLILDNVEDLGRIRDFLPLEPSGHILLTTRVQATGPFARRIDLEQMHQDEGALFLLRRTSLITKETPLTDVSEEWRALATTITQLMGGLPLALDQAGAYIEETGCGLAKYRDRYHDQQALLLDRRGEGDPDHPQSVAATLSLTFERVERTNAAALELLHLCAFLHPDAIPEEMITKGASDLDPALQVIVLDPMKLDAAIKELRRYSLLRRNSDLQTFTIHRVVQAVIKGRMEERTQCHWAERAVRIINRALPNLADAFTWECDALYLPQAQRCVSLIEQWDIVSIEAGQLLNRLASYFIKHGYYAQAEVPFKMALDIRLRLLGAEHPEVTESLSNLAALYQAQGDYLRAEPLYRQALAIRERTVGYEHPTVAESLSNLALLHRDLGKLEEAEQFFQRALAIQERTLEPDHPKTATTCNGLGVLYGMQGRYNQAERLLQRALVSGEKTLGEGHPEVGVALNNLAKLYSLQGNYVQAEELYQRALTIYEQVFGSEHPNIATTLGNLALLSVYQGQYSRAEVLYQQALGIREQALGRAHPRTAHMLNDLAMLYAKQERYAEAELLYQRALCIFEKTFEREHPSVVAVREHYASLLTITKRDADAAKLVLRTSEMGDRSKPGAELK